MCIKQMHWCTNARMPSQYIALFYCVRRSESLLENIDDEPSESIIVYEMHHSVSSNNNNSSKWAVSVAKFIVCIGKVMSQLLADCIQRIRVQTQHRGWAQQLTFGVADFTRKKTLWCVQQANKKGIEKEKGERGKKLHGGTKPHLAVQTEYVPI